MQIRVLLVDVQLESRPQLEALLETQSDIEVVLECSSATLGVETLERSRANLTLVEIALLNKSCSSFLSDSQSFRLPNMVVIAGTDDYALHAFEAGAVDYLLKPLSRNRFQKAIDKVREHIKMQQAFEHTLFAASLLHKEASAKNFTDRLVYRDKGKIIVIPTAEIQWIEAEGNYVRVHTKKQAYLFRETISGIEKKLDPAHFARVHRCSIVSIKNIREFQPWGEGGNSNVLLRDETKVSLGPKYRQKLSELLMTT